MSKAKKDEAGKVAAPNAEAESERDEQEEEEEGEEETSDEDESSAEDESDESDTDEADEQVAAAPAAPVRRAEVREPMRFSATTLVAVAALVGAGAFAAGRSTGGSDVPPERTAQAAPSDPQKPSPMGMGMGGGGGAPGMGAPGMGMGGGGNPSEGLPPGHPPAGDMPPSGMGMGAPGAGGDVAPASISWKAPDRWQQVPNPSTMRLATYRIPKAAGDAEDPELTITQAGGTVEANAQRWIGQFGPEAAKTAKRSTRSVGGLEVAIVEVEGKYANGMGKEGREEEQWAMLGAIVQTPGMPHFFKLTGPAKSVKAARAEFDAFVGSVKTR